MNKNFLEKFFKLYSKCSEAYAEYLGLEKYLIISYYKIDIYIHMYQYIDFNLLFCKKTGIKNDSENQFLQAKFIANKHDFLINNFKNDDLDSVIILDDIGKKIKDNFDAIQKNDVISLNNIYKSILLLSD